MVNFVNAEYSRTGKSLNTDELGMREMQRRAFKKRQSKYLLIKAPPASGKSRALMFLGLDKLYNQGIKKVIVAVPEKIIGASFERVNLKKFGFFEDWDYDDNYNLCTPGGDEKKVRAFRNFIEDKSATILICTHATLRFAFNEIDPTKFKDYLFAIDEFHHVSTIESRLGEVLNNLMNKTNSHIIAMTGSYFRGDSVPILFPEDEEKFDKVTYNYYEQLNGYTYLKTLGIGYHFYQGKYLDAIKEVLDTDKKTILHIPNVNSAEALKNKYREVDSILAIIGDVIKQDSSTGVIHVERKEDKKIIKVADLVNDEKKSRDKIDNFLREMNEVDDIDIIIALGKAKEGFDWPYCEHALTIGYRGSMTEIIQIIGRATRDSSNKTHSQFTHLIAQPDAPDDEVKISVNDVLKAITASLLMEQVLAPHVKFKSRKEYEEFEPGTIGIKGFKEPSTKKVKEIIETEMNDLKASIYQDDQMLKAMPGSIDPEVISKIIVPRIIKSKYPDLTNDEIDEVRDYYYADTVIKSGKLKNVGDKRFILMADKFINIDDLHIDLIYQINPFQKNFEVLSKNINAPLLKTISDYIASQKIQMTKEEALFLYKNKIGKFMEKNQRKPKIDSNDPNERRMAEAIIFLKNLQRAQ